MFPEGLSIKQVDQVIYWTNYTGKITEQEALEVSTQIRELVTNNRIDAVIVDNRELKGVWKPEVDKIWIDLMEFLPTQVDRTATLCENIINKLQLNYLSSQAGTEDTVKAFVDEERQEMMSFLKVPVNIKDTH